MKKIYSSDNNINDDVPSFEVIRNNNNMINM